MNSEKYNFSDFTFSNYESLIRLAKEKHVFRFYDNFHKEENFVLWRHDIDMSVENALQLSEIEKKNGVCATYFVHLHSEYYNFLAKRSFDKLKQISANGHQLGLHFDPGFYSINSKKDLMDKLEYEKSSLEKAFDIEVKVYSYHNPTEDILKFDDYEYLGVINTYSKYFKEIQYASDSNGYWRHKSIQQVITENPERPLQILTHPEWWSKEISSPKERVWGCIDINAEELKSNYDIELGKYGRKNIDWN